MCVCVCVWHYAACAILVPWPGIEPVPPAVEAQGPNEWTPREFPALDWILLPNFCVSGAHLGYCEVKELIHIKLSAWNTPSVLKLLTIIIF